MSADEEDSTNLVAWVDESGSDRAIDPGTYIMAAAITEESQVENVRSAMSGLLLRGQVKLHWRDERASRQRAIAKAIAEVGIEHLVVVTTPHDSQRPERQRRLTLELLLPELARLGVARAVLESRGRADDLRDRKMLDYLRRQRILEYPFHIDHQVGRHEPMLWVPDAVCGMVTSLRGGNGTYFELVRSQITLHVVAPK